MIKFLMEDFFNVGVKAVIKNDDGDILALRLNKHEMKNRIGWSGQEMWDIPGGRIQKGSNTIETLENEVRQELDRKIIQLKFLTSTIASTRLKNKHYGDIGLVLFIYEVKIDDGPIILNSENELYQWLSPLEVSEKLSTKYPPEFCEIIKNLNYK